MHCRRRESSRPTAALFGDNPNNKIGLTCFANSLDKFPLAVGHVNGQKAKHLYAITGYVPQHAVIIDGDCSNGILTLAISKADRKELQIVGPFTAVRHIAALPVNDEPPVNNAAGLVIPADEKHLLRYCMNPQTYPGPLGDSDLPALQDVSEQIKQFVTVPSYNKHMSAQLKKSSTDELDRQAKIMAKYNKIKTHVVDLARHGAIFLVNDLRFIPRAVLKLMGKEYYNIQHRSIYDLQ